MRTFTNYIVKNIADTRKDLVRPMRDYDVVIQTGAALTDERIPGAIYDNTGDNISELNEQYCELCALYYIWKNVDRDYYGLEHYRRMLDTKEENIADLLAGKIDAIIPQKWEGDIENLESQYKTVHCADAWNCMVQILQEMYPENFKTIESVFAGSDFRGCNMGIFSKEFLNEYCTWLFPILKRVVTVIGSKWDIYQNRYPGFLAERLYTLFLFLNQERFRFREVPIRMLDNGTDEIPENEDMIINNVVDFVNNRNVSVAWRYLNLWYSKKMIYESVILYNLTKLLNYAHKKMLEDGDAYLLQNCKSLENLMDIYCQNYQRCNEGDFICAAVYALGNESDKLTGKLIHLYNLTVDRNKKKSVFHLFAYMEKDTCGAVFNANSDLYMDVETVIRGYKRGIIAAVIMPIWLLPYQDNVVGRLVACGLKPEDIYTLKYTGTDDVRLAIEPYAFE